MSLKIVQSEQPERRMKKIELPKRLFSGLSEKAQAKLERDFQKAKADPLAQQMVDNLNRAALNSAQEQLAASKGKK
jgi:phage gp29-like protein